MSTFLRTFSQRRKRNYTNNNRRNTSEPDSRFAVIAFISGRMSTRPREFLEHQLDTPTPHPHISPIGVRVCFSAIQFDSMECCIRRFILMRP